MSDMWAKIDKLQEQLNHIDTRTTVHEQICAERYGHIHQMFKLVLVAIGLLTCADMFGANHLIVAIFKHFGIN